MEDASAEENAVPKVILTRPSTSSITEPNDEAAIPGFTENAEDKPGIVKRRAFKDKRRPSNGGLTDDILAGLPEAVLHHAEDKHKFSHQKRMTSIEEAHHEVYNSGHCNSVLLPRKSAADVRERLSEKRISVMLQSYNNERAIAAEKVEQGYRKKIGKTASKAAMKFTACVKTGSQNHLDLDHRDWAEQHLERHANDGRSGHRNALKDVDGIQSDEGSDEEMSMVKKPTLLAKIAGAQQEKLLRSPAKPNEDEETVDHTYGLLTDIVKRKGGLKKFLLFLGDVVSPFSEYFMDAYKKEEFHAVVHEDVMEFYKNPGAMAASSLRNKSSRGKPSEPCWEKTGLSTLCSHVAAIVKHKRDVSMLKVEVDNYVMRWKLLNTAIADPAETEREEQSRKAEFWGQYKEVARVNALPPLASITAKYARKAPEFNNYQQYPTAFKSKSGRALPFDADGQWTEIRNLDDEEDSKVDTSMSPVRRSMKFTPGSVNSMKWEVQNPAMGTRAAMIRSIVEKSDLNVQEEKIQSSGMHMNFFNRSRSSPSLQVTPRGSRAISKRAESKRSDDAHNLSVEEVPLSNAPTDRYVQACQRTFVIPSPNLQFVTGHSRKLLADGQDLKDNDLRAVASMIREVNCLEEIDLDTNALLTEKAIVPFLERLFDAPGIYALEKMSMRELKHMKIASFDVITRLLTEESGAQNLKWLDLSQIKIAPKCHVKLANAISTHSCLEIVALLDTSLGSNSQIATMCVQKLMSSKSMVNLNIGWNCLSVEVFQALGAALAASPRLTSLSVANCSAAAAGPPPITYFLECLSSDASLTYLDLSLNSLDFRSSLILEDCLEHHKQLHKLNLSNNPMGTLGIRSALRLLSGPTSGLISFDATGSYSGSEMRAQCFNMVNPGGRYALELHRPYHRSQMRMLYKCCERMKQHPDQMFSSIQYSQGSWTHGSKDSRGIFQVPTTGKLKFFINVEAAIGTCVKGVKDYDFDNFIRAFAEVTKVQPAFKKIIPLMASWKMLDGKTVEQHVFLNSMAKDVQLSPAQLEHLVSNCKAEKSTAIEILLPCVAGGQGRCLSALLFPTVGEFVRKHQTMRTFLDFNAQNPTGHYKLFLENCCDHAVGERLLLMNSWEGMLDAKLQRKDTSQRGNGQHIRNEQYGSNPLHIQCPNISDFQLPEIDVLEFDYVSGKRCPPTAVVIGEQTFKNILISLFDAGCSAVSKIQVLRLVSHHIFLTSIQMRELIGIFQTEHDRAEAFVVFYNQIVDMWNSKVFRVRFSSAKEVESLRQRLGHASFFPFIQPENSRFSLKLDVADQRLCLTVLVQLAFREALGWANIKDPEWIHSDGRVDPLATGVPQIWQSLNSAPREGTFTCRYGCAPEGRKLKIRTAFAETYGALSMDIEESDVMWWTGLLEPPKDVVALVEFIMGSSYKSMAQAFTSIDGPGGNGEITLGEFREGMDKIGCKKFEGPGKAERIAGIFRYLDPGMEGSVSKGEWNVLQQVWNEIDFCIAEFVEFLIRTFGDLDTAWDFLDADKSGSLDLDEWMPAVEGVGYFGPAECVFGILDFSGDNDVSMEEFAILGKYINFDAAQLFSPTLSPR